MDADAYRDFLTEIGYLQPEPGDFTITTSGVDDEIKTMAGPQLVVPVTNARFALNAANARWGSLYDALYGTDAIPENDGAEKGSGYNQVRGDRVIAYARKFLDGPCRSSGSSPNATGINVEDGQLQSPDESEQSQRARRPGAVRRVHRRARSPTSVLLRHHGLHIEILIDPGSPIGKTDRAGVKDVILESAITTIVDFEDSVAAVDADDKVLGYRNWLGLNRGDLTEEVEQGRQDLHPDAQRGPHLHRTRRRRVHPARPQPAARPQRRSPDDQRRHPRRRRQRGVRGHPGRPVHRRDRDPRAQGLARRGNGPLRNSRTGSIYIVKPKKHGPDEVAFTVELFSRVEDVLGLPPGTLKVGIMDEERRTTVNLRACIKAAADRVVFINTGFLDRTGDEIHTSMEAGPMVRKAAMKSQPWILAYEDHNVDAGLAPGSSVGPRSARACGPCPT